MDAKEYLKTKTHPWDNLWYGEHSYIDQSGLEKMLEEYAEIKIKEKYGTNISNTTSN